MLLTSAYALVNTAFWLVNFPRSTCAQRFYHIKIEIQLTSLMADTVSVLNRHQSFSLHVPYITRL